MRTRTGLSQALLVVAVLAAGCSGDTDPAPPPDAGTDAETTPEASAPASSEEPTETDTSSSTTSPTSTDSDDGSIPELPPEAEESTEEGAAAFAEYYVELYNYAGMRPESGVLEAHSGSDCSSCDGFVETMAYLAEGDLHYSGPVAKIERSVARNLGPTTTAWVLVDQLPVSTLDKEGNVTERVEADTFAMVFDLSRDGDEWSINEIQIDPEGDLPA